MHVSCTTLLGKNSKLMAQTWKKLDPETRMVNCIQLIFGYTEFFQIQTHELTFGVNRVVSFSFLAFSGVKIARNLVNLIKYCKARIFNESDYKRWAYNRGSLIGRRQGICV